MKASQLTLRKVHVLVGPGSSTVHISLPLSSTPTSSCSSPALISPSGYCTKCGGGCFVDNKVTSEFERNQNIERSTHNLTDFSTRCSWTTPQCIISSCLPLSSYASQQGTDHCLKRHGLWRPYLNDTNIHINVQPSYLPTTKRPWWKLCRLDPLQSPKLGDRPYQCDQGSCRKAFARNEELTRHKRIHSGERPHQCEMCRKSFGRKDHLTKHRKTHLKPSERRTYGCHVDGCERRYTRSDALTRHQWSVHNIKWKPGKDLHIEGTRCPIYLKKNGI